MNAVVKCVSISPREDKFLKENHYSPSKLLQFSIMKLMEKSEGEDFASKPTDEPTEDSNNG